MPEVITYNPTLSNISLQYRGEDLIWREVMPPIKVASRAPLIRKYNKEERFRVPNDNVGARSRPNMVDWGVTLVPIAVRDHALQEPVSATEEREAAAEGVLALQADAAEFVSRLLNVAQEQRVANIVFAAASYPTGNKVTLSGTSQWSDIVNSNPLSDIMAGLDAAFIRPNKMVLGPDTARSLRQHPKILDAIKGKTGAAPRGGIATAQELADLFELSMVLVGRNRINTAKEGQTAAYSRLWGKHCSLLYVDPNPSRRSIMFGASFCETLPASMRTYFDENTGPEGSTIVSGYWNSDEEVTASDVGYFIENAVA